MSYCLALLLLDLLRRIVIPQEIRIIHRSRRLRRRRRISRSAADRLFEEIVADRGWWLLRLADAAFALDIERGAFRIATPWLDQVALLVNEVIVVRIAKQRFFIGLELPFGQVQLDVEFFFGAVFDGVAHIGSKGSGGCAPALEA